MKKFGQGFIVGILITLLLTASIALAVDNPIKLIINGQEIKPDIAPRLINGRVMVPARFVAEPLGATVEWDAKNNAVIVKSKDYVEIVSSTNDWVSLREIATIANVVVSDQIYIEKGDIKIVLNPNDYTFIVMKAGSAVDSGQAKLENYTTYLPLSILQKYGLR